jgi:hypothetical protein
MKFLTSLSVLTALGMSVLVYACSSSDTTLDGLGASSGGSGNTATAANGSTTSSNAGGTGSGTKSTARGGGSGIIINTKNTMTDADAACGASEQPAEITPIYMIFAYDKSGSMGDDPVQNVFHLSQRWEPLKAGMLDFFANVGTTSGGVAPGVKAGIKFFPAAGDKTATCHADYGISAASMTPLESPQPLIDALNRTTPGGGTPTLPAVMGAIASAKKIMTSDVGSIAVVVLVTDGEPGIWNSTTQTFDHDCAPTNADPSLQNDIPGIVSVVRAAYEGTPRVSTYVIGIGEAGDAMGEIATAGGTEYLQLDASSAPETTRKLFADKLNSIRTTAIPCMMSIPKTADFRKDLVNVNFKHSDGKPTESIGKSAGCSAPGWYFDNESTPTKINLCPAACSAIQKDQGGSLQILLGCPTLIL